MEWDEGQTEPLREAFRAFREDPLERFRVKVRRHRAGQLRELLSRPDRIDLETFNREVWQFESAAFLNGRDVKGHIFGGVGGGTPLKIEQLPEYEAALTSGGLELHGNMIWGSGSHVFAPMIKESEAEKEGLVREALHLLNDTGLSPVEKVKKIKALKGFGDNITTGLAMVYHPDEISSYSFPPKKTLGLLGGRVQPYEAFVEDMRALKSLLGADDYLELDWFLYLRHLEPEGQKTETTPPADEDVSGESGLDRDSAAQAREILQKLFPEEASRSAVLNVFSRSIREADLQGGAAWGLTLTSSYVSLNVGRITATNLLKEELRLGVMGESLNEEDREILKEYIRPGFKEVKGMLRLYLPPQKMDLISPEVWVAHRALVEKVARTSAGRLSDTCRKAHSPGVLGYIKEILGEDLPDPCYADTDDLGSPVRYWWVNQGQSYGEERQGGYVWARRTQSDGRMLNHHIRLKDLKVGDLLFHYADKRIRALSRVTSPAREELLPSEHHRTLGSEEGYEVRVDYHDLDEELPIDLIPLEWRREEKGAFDRNGSALQGYLYPVSEGFAEKLGQKFSSILSLLEELSVKNDVVDHRIVKIAPGHDAEYWPECLGGGYICVGWDEVGDLRDYLKREEFQERFREVYREKHSGHAPTLSRKANEVWTLRELRPGDLVVANRGKSRVVGIGEVEAPGYEWRPDLEHYRHTVKVRWFDTQERTIPEQPTWATSTVAEISPDLYDQIREGDLPPPKNVWLFQANPSFYDLAREIRQFQTGDDDDWLVTRYREEMKDGDVVVLWQSGKAAGIYGVGELTGEPEECDPLPWRREKGEKEWRVPFHYTRILSEPVRRTDLQGDPILGDLQVLRSPQGTNFKVSTGQWAALRPLLFHASPSYEEPPFGEIRDVVEASGLRIDARTLRRYHLSLKTRDFVILSGLSGTGKTWLTRAYADAVGAAYRLVPVAPNWTANEDLLGYRSPVTNRYHDTNFSTFLREAAREYEAAVAEGRTPRPYHLALDEMNLARVEYYFAKFLSAMEVRAGGTEAELELGPEEKIALPPNLSFIGTVNVDETTHGFAEKVYDRAQLIELGVSRELLADHLEGAPYRDHLLEVWDRLHGVAPFAYRTLDEFGAYVEAAETIGGSWGEAFDEQLLQKILPKVKGMELSVGEALEWLVEFTRDRYPLSHAKAGEMLDGYRRHNFASYF